MVRVRRINILFFILFLQFATSAFSQSLVIGKVQDAFLKKALPGVKVSLLLAKDSTVVIDSIPLHGKTFNIEFKEGERKTCNYLLHATLDGYEDAWGNFSIEADNEGWIALDDLELQRMFNSTMKEVAVTATKVKMYYKGDTLVYNADAFQLPDGSMLDDLIRQLPGVEMDEYGQIFVNGRKIDDLLLGSRTFMGGNQEVMLKNLPYFTVKDIKVYDKQTRMSESIGRDIEPRRFVMDVNLKREYSVGYIANIEAGGGTQKRWLGRAFAMRFSDRWRWALMANANNVNEGGYLKESGNWTPYTRPQSLQTTYGGCGEVSYYNPHTKLENKLNVDFKSVDDFSKMRQRYEQFLDGHSPTSLTSNMNDVSYWTLKVRNDFGFIKPLYLNGAIEFLYYKRNATGQSQFQQMDDNQPSSELIASKRTDGLSDGRSVNILYYMIVAKGGQKWHGNWQFYLKHYDSQSWLSNRFDTWQQSTQTHDIRRNASDVLDKSTDIHTESYITLNDVLGKVSMLLHGKFAYKNQRNHDFLYHPDTLLLASQLDMLTAITDPANSYDSHKREWNADIDFRLFQRSISGGLSHDRWTIGVKVPVSHRMLDYQRGKIDTLMYDTKVYVSPHAGYNYVSRGGGKHDFSINASYNRSTVDLVSRIAYRDDSQPLVVKEGNPDLKGIATTNVNADYKRKFKKNGMWHLGTSFNYRHRDVAQSVAYNPKTGVYTYKPMNVNGGYNVTGRFDISSHIGEKRYWTWQMNMDADYTHSVDHTLLAGETMSHVNAVNTFTLHDGGYIQYNKGMLNVRAKADVSWRHSEGQMRDFETLDAVDLNYGLSARYTIPKLNTTISAEGTMYMRSGYGSDLLNTNDFVLNASLSQPFFKGKLIAKVEGFDLLHQLSSTQYSVNAQGRTETWYRSLPHYVMFHLVYHFNKNPKKK